MSDSTALDRPSDGDQQAIDSLREWIGAHGRLLWSPALERGLLPAWRDPRAGPRLVAQWVDEALERRASRVGAYVDAIFSRHLAESPPPKPNRPFAVARWSSF